MSKKNDIEIVTIKGVDMVVVYSKTRKGKPHPKGGVYTFFIPVDEYKPK